MTQGGTSYGIFAHSIGGGGGESDASVGLAAVSGTAGGGGYGATVTVTNNAGGNITTSRAYSTPI